MKLFILGLLLIPHLLFSQSQEDFENKTTSVFISLPDTLKAAEIAMETYEMVENHEDLQTLANYYMLKAIFDTIKNEELAEVCEKKAKARMVFNTQVEKPSSYDNPTLEWTYEYQLEFYKSKDRDLGKRALKFLKQHPELINFTNYSALAHFFERNHDFDLAEKYYGLAFNHIDYQNNEFVSLIQPAFYYMKVGEYQKVEDCLQLNNDLIKQANQYTKPGYESSRDMIQMFYYLFIGDYHKYIQSAEVYYRQQYEQNKDNLIGNPYASISKLNRAIGYEYLKMYDQAEQHYRESEVASVDWLQTMKETYPNYEQVSFPILNIFLAKRGDLDNLEERIAELDDYYEYIENYSAPTLGQQVQKAIQYALYRDERYPDLFESIIDQLSKARDYNESTIPHAQFAYFNTRDESFNKADRIYSRLFDQNLRWINDLIFTFGEKAFVAYFTTKLREGYQNYHSFVKITGERDESLHRRLVGKAYDNILLTKSIAFKGIRKRKKAFEKSNSPETVELYNQWQSKKQELIRMYQMAQQDHKDLAASLHVVQDSSTATIISKDQLEALQREIDLLENRLASSSDGFEETLRVAQPKWQSVRGSLKPGEAAVEMIRFHWRDQIYYSDTAYYAAYIIKHDSDFPEVVYLPSLADQLDTRHYNFYRNSIQLRIEGDSYDQYWEPIKSKLEGVKRVYFSPDGVYHLINLPTLKNQRTGEFLLDETEIVNVTTTGNIEGDNEESELSSAVLIGRPLYAASSGIQLEELQTRSFSKNFRNASIADLPGTEDEIISIRTVLEQEGITTAQFIGPHASEDGLYQLQSPDILHIATHGFWSGTESATPGYRILNAMINSGLLMAGVVDYYSSDVLAASNDGILTAYEAQSLELEGTDLVVLSACETGLGDLDAGEGVYGLQRAFRTAGAKSVVTSLWKVDDQGTKDFMITFYQQMASVSNKRAAFRSAQLAMKKKYKDPYYWGAFVLIGN